MDTTTISELANKTPTGNMFTVIEDGGSTGKTTIDDFVAAADIIGKSNMGTTAQTITGAIAEHENDISEMRQTISEHADDIQSVADTIGDLSGLNTVAQGSIVSAINEVDANTDANASAISTINTAIGSTALPTTAQTLAGAIAEHENDISQLNSNIGNIRYAQYAVSGGSSRSITLATWAVYLVSTFLGFHVVFTGSSSYTPVIETVRGNSSLPVTSEASATIVLGNTTGSTYQFSVIRIL